MTVAQRLAGEMCDLRTAALPPAVIARASDFLLDYLGVTLGGVPEESSATLRRGLAALHGRGDVAVLGTPDRLPAPEAALANGAAAHALEMDDTHQGGSIHLGASVYSAALAAAQLTGASGDALLRAAIAGYEVAARLAMALRPGAHYARGFHPTGTCGAFGAATAAGLLMGLDAPALAAALGVAGSQASGSMEFLADGAWTKRFHPGWAAAAGLHAAALAGAGFHAPASVFEGRFGTLHAYSDDADVIALAPGDGFEIMRTSVKPHACCRYMQAPIDAVLALRAAHDLDPNAVERVEVGVVAAAFPIVCEPEPQKRRPTSVVDAQFSLPFGVALALLRGRATPEDFAPAVMTDAPVVRLMERVVAVRDAALDAQYPRVWPAWVRIGLANGAVLESRIEHPRGDPENPLSPAELRDKFRTLAGRVLAPARIEALADRVTALPAGGSVADVVAAAV